MLEHADSPYIRCIGFLYLRYAAAPETLSSWFEPYLHDQEPVQIKQGRKDSTVGDFCQSLLENMDYYGTRLPRLPLTTERQVKVKILQSDRMEERAHRHLKNKAAMEYFQKVGAKIQALYGDEENPITWYDAVVERVILRDQESGESLSRPKFQVIFPEYGNAATVTLGEVDLPGSDDSKRPAIEERGGGRSGYSSGRDYRDGKDRGKDIDDRGHSNRRDSGYRRDPSPPRRDRSRSRDRGDNLNDARREEEELMEEVLRRERDKSAATGRAYASKSVTFFRGECRLEESRHGAHKSDWQPPANKGKPTGEKKDNSKRGPPPPAPTAAELAVIQEKKRKLMARYG